MGKVIQIPELSTSDLAKESTQKQSRDLLLSIDSKHNTLGQKTSEGSMPVVLSEEQQKLLTKDATLSNLFTQLLEQQMITNELLKIIIS